MARVAVCFALDSELCSAEVNATLTGPLRRFDQGSEAVLYMWLQGGSASWGGVVGGWGGGRVGWWLLDPSASSWVGVMGGLGGGCGTLQRAGGVSGWRRAWAPGGPPASGDVRTAAACLTANSSCRYYRAAMCALPAVPSLGAQQRPLSWQACQPSRPFLAVAVQRSGAVEGPRPCTSCTSRYSTKPSAPPAGIATLRCAMVRWHLRQSVGFVLACTGLCPQSENVHCIMPSFLETPPQAQREKHPFSNCHLATHPPSPGQQVARCGGDCGQQHLSLRG